MVPVELSVTQIVVMVEFSLTLDACSNSNITSTTKVSHQLKICSMFSSSSKIIFLSDMVIIMEQTLLNENLLLISLRISSGNVQTTQRIPWLRASQY